MSDEALSLAVKATQEALAPLQLSKPPLSEKLLSRPPFRYLHDLISEVSRVTGFAKDAGILSDSQWDASQVTDKEGKVAFLTPLIQYTASVTGQTIDAQPAKIVAGLDPIATNRFLQAIAKAATTSGTGAAEAKTSAPSPKSKVVEPVAVAVAPVQPPAPPAAFARPTTSSSTKQSPQKVERPSSSSRNTTARPPSAAGAAAAATTTPAKKSVKIADEPAAPATTSRGVKIVRDTVAPQPPSPSLLNQHEVNLIPEPSNQRIPTVPATLAAQAATESRAARPLTARAGPPRPKTAILQPAVGAQQASRPAVSSPHNTEDEDDGMIVMSSLSEMMHTGTEALLEEQEDSTHGALVRKMLEARSDNSEKENRSGSSNESKTHAKEQAQKEVGHLRHSLQDFVSHLVPIRKLLDYLPEDIDSMSREYLSWQKEEHEWEQKWKETAKKSQDATAPLEEELAALEQSIRQAKETLRECKTKTSENDAMIKRLVDGFLQQQNA